MSVESDQANQMLGSRVWKQSNVTHYHWVSEDDGIHIFANWLNWYIHCVNQVNQLYHSLVLEAGHSLKKQHSMHNFTGVWSPCQVPQDKILYEFYASNNFILPLY